MLPPQAIISSRAAVYKSVLHQSSSSNSLFYLDLIIDFKSIRQASGVKTEIEINTSARVVDLGYSKEILPFFLIRDFQINSILIWKKTERSFDNSVFSTAEEQPQETS